VRKRLRDPEWWLLLAWCVLVGWPLQILVRLSRHRTPVKRSL
jgi:hypothetical protein